MQAQGDVGVFGGVMRRIVDRDLRERDRLRALAGHVLVLHGLVAKMTLRQRIHVVPRDAGIQHEALQHRVVGIALHLDAVATQHVQVVLAVLAEFPLRRIGQQRAQCVEYRRARQLHRRTGIVVRQRDVAGLAGFDAEADADQVGAQRIQRVGFGIEGEFVGGLQLRDPAR